MIERLRVAVRLDNMRRVGGHIGLDHHPLNSSLDDVVLGAVWELGDILSPLVTDNDDIVLLVT